MWKSIDVLHFNFNKFRPLIISNGYFFCPSVRDLIDHSPKNPPGFIVSNLFKEKEETEKFYNFLNLDKKKTYLQKNPQKGQI